MFMHKKRKGRFQCRWRYCFRSGVRCLLLLHVDGKDCRRVARKVVHSQEYVVVGMVGAAQIGTMSVVTFHVMRGSMEA